LINTERKEKKRKEKKRKEKKGKKKKKKKNQRNLAYSKQFFWAESSTSVPFRLQRLHLLPL